MIDFVCHAIPHVFQGFGNILFNGFDFELTKEDKTKQIGIRIQHFYPISTWELSEGYVVDKSTGDRYFDDSHIRLKCAALFAASFIVHPMGLTLTLLNKIAKVTTFAHIWKTSQNPYNFSARIAEWTKDLLVVVTTPLILVGLFFAAAYGGTISPKNGRKLYATLERLAYSGGYQAWGQRTVWTNDVKTLVSDPQNYLLAPCFQPEPIKHLGGGSIDEKDAW